MRTQAIIPLAMPLCAIAQQPRVLPPNDISPSERYTYVQPLSFSTDPITGRCACMACVIVQSTGEYVQVRMSCNDCNDTIQGDSFSLDVTKIQDIIFP